MGNALNYSMALTGIGKQDERKLLMLGMGGAGKTSILYKLNIGQNIHPVPFTMGIDAEIFEYKKIKMIVWDMIGIRRIMKKIWRHFYEGSHGLIFVVDSNDEDQMGECAIIFDELIRTEELKEVKLLILANKQDLPNAISISELTQRLNLKYIRDRPWYVQPTCAVTGDGLVEGMQWICNALNIECYWDESI